MKMLKLFTSLAMVSVVLFAGCKKDDFVEIDGLCPLVIATDPVNGATNVPLNKIITVTFNEKMNPLTITNLSFTIKDGSAIEGTISYNGVTATFTPTELLQPNTTYTGRVNTTVKDSTGNALQTDYVWTFTTGLTMAPLVISTDPANGATNVPLDKIITARFSVPMNPLSITTSSFIISEGTTSIIGTVSYDGVTATFRPIGDLKPNTIYTGTITIGVTDVNGTVLMNDYVWEFATLITGPAIIVTTDPANNATNVNLSKIITASFSVPMNPATINAASFTLNLGATPVAGTITYSGTTATFTPSSNLIPNVTYTGRITTSAKDLNGNGLASDHVWIFSTGTTLSPEIMSTDPANNAFGVNLNKIISATFSVPMDPLTINSSTFIVRQGANVIPGTIWFSGTTASFDPATSLSPNTIYSVTMTTGVKNNAGTPMAYNYTWIFTTAGGIPPTVIATDPLNNANNVALNKIITASFSVPMNPLSINATSFTLKEGATSIPGIITYSGTTASFTPSTALLSYKIYTATITTASRDVSGTPLANDYVWTFTTMTAVPPIVISTDPANNAVGVALNKVISASFNMPMDASSIHSSSFTLLQGSTLIPGMITYSGTTAYFTPFFALSANKVYTATITTAVKNLAGIPLANNHVWIFTTAAAIAPTVITTDPLNNATGVALNKIVVANFDMFMDPLTINSTTYTLKQGSTLIAGIVTYSGMTASFTPTNALAPNTTYTATMTTGAKNLAGIPLANDYVWSFTTKAGLNPPFVDLKSAGRFGIAAGVGISNNAGFSEIHNMDVGISPGVRSSITGFPPATIINGAIYASDDIAPPGTAAMLIQAKADLTSAYLFAQGATTPAPITVSGDQGGKTLAPGIYKTTSTLLIQSGDLTLDAQGDPNAVWIFQIASGFTTIGGAGGSIILSGGAQAANIFWQTGTSATIGDGTSFEGNVLALTSITMNSNATATGRMLAINGAVVMTNTNIINKP